MIPGITTQMAHALTHAWPIWTHHREPLYVCTDDTFDLLTGMVSEADMDRIEMDIFLSLAEHGIRLDSDNDDIAETYGCPYGLPMPPKPSEGDER